MDLLPMYKPSSYSLAILAFLPPRGSITSGTMFS